jgi:rhamnose utilization protein RhaD (predicted bifunctional aldolase and dehydrogenase)/NAD(P)-dependent dehydrogenase (short-subunit alcohol dehydrogenase family)
MKSLWNDEEAAAYPGDLAQRVYTSRLLGREKSLVLHGGGNTSVKIQQADIFGEPEDILYVKGSGWDLETIAEAGFSPVRLKRLLSLARLPALSDPEMVNELRTHMTSASAPTPSVEAILHATIPHKYVDHTHANAVIAVTNTTEGEERVREIYGDDIVVIPYVMPGFDLARLCAERFAAEAHDGTLGMVLLNHGIFSFGGTARESYEHMIALVDRAETYLERRGAWPVPLTPPAMDSPPPATEIAELRRAVSDLAGVPLLLTTYRDETALAFCRHKEIASISQQGPATPDHVIRTKRLPMLGRDVAAYAQAYREYFAENAPLSKDEKTILDAAPRLILDPEIGMCAVGRSAKDAAIVADIYRHTINIILSAEALGGYRALPARDIFDVEYWDLEQAKLKKAGAAPPFAGEVVLITGAASGIGKACVASFLARGAAVIGLDISSDVAESSTHAAFLGVRCDLTEETQLAAAIDEGVRRFGGIDMLVLNAGIFPSGCRVESLLHADWRKVMAVNLDANLDLLRSCYPLLREAPRAGRVAIIGSKNVAAPGPGAAAYSASKAALNQLARVTALEWAGDGIRINSLHPDAVFDTGIWTPNVLEARARHYGMSVAEYKTKNLLKTEIQSRDVAELAAEMCGPLFSKVTGAQLPVDGGNDRVI